MEQSAQNSLVSEEYSKLTGFDGKWRETWWRKDYLELILSRLGASQTKNLLDVGCGVGHWGRTLSQALPEGLAVAGIDIDLSFVERSRELGRAYGLAKMDYRQAPAEKIPFPDDSFDLVTCQTVLIHVRDPLAVIQEMMRVTRPGGVVLLAEPNNLPWYFNLLLAEPRASWEVVQTLSDFYHTCLLGKKELGHGDSSVGEKLPLLAARAGLREVQVSTNENCPALIPPYATEREQIETQFLKSCIESGAWLGFGPRHNARRFFLAGGGAEGDFDARWESARQQQAGMLAAMNENTFGGGRAGVMYLVGGRK